MRTRLCICARKRRFAEGERAEAAAAATGFALRAYRCDRCNQFHLTSRRKGKRIPRPSVQESLNACQPFKPGGRNAMWEQ